MPINTDDFFGTATTKANIGVSLCELNRHAEALGILEEAYKDLLVFGPHHLNLVQNDLGIAKMHLGQVKEAAEDLARAARSSDLMPRTYARINRAVAYALEGDAAKGLAELASLQGDAAAAPVDRVRQRYYINRAVLYCASEMAWEDRQSAILDASKHPDRKYPDRTTRVVEELIRTRNLKLGPLERTALVRRLWQPCYLEYWYQNPLSALSDSFRLTATAVSKDVRH